MSVHLLLVLLLPFLLVLLYRNHLRPVFPAGPQPRSSAPSALPDLNPIVRVQCSLSDLNRDRPRPVFPVGPQPQNARKNVRRYATKNVRKNVRRCARKNVRRYASRMSGDMERMSDRMLDMPGRVPERMSEDALERMSERM